MKKPTLCLLMAALSLCSCHKDQPLPATPSGNYRGSLREVVTTTQAQSSALLSSQVQISIAGRAYQCASSDIGISRGTFVADGHTLVFTDSLAHNAYYNWNFLLSGRFAEGIKGDSLVWTKTLGKISYVYTLKKQ